MEVDFNIGPDNYLDISYFPESKLLTALYWMFNGKEVPCISCRNLSIPV